MGGIMTKRDESTMTSVHSTKLEAKILEAMRRRESQGTSMKSFNTIILKFPKIDTGLRKCKAIFEEFDEDKSGTIDPKELNHCFRKLEIDFTDEEINDIFVECDINDDMGINFKEFIVLLCLVYLLKKDRVSGNSQLAYFIRILWICKTIWLYHIYLLCQLPVKEGGFDIHLLIHLTCYGIGGTKRVGIPGLEATFETLVDSFVFLDKNKDGYVSKNEMVRAINETISGERSSGRIAMRRFEEMDWDKNGMVNFKEFLFAFTKWVGIEDVEDEEEGADE